MRRALLCALLLLGGCADGPIPWARSGAAGDQAAADYSACRAQARASVNRALGSEIDRLDMMSAPPTLTGQNTNMIQDMQRAQLAAEARRRQDGEAASCMRAKGYSPR
jgi:hypothetical protein